MRRTLFERLFSLIVGLLLCSIAKAQGVNVTGIVIDDDFREPLSGVTIIEKGTQNGSITDLDGKFSLNVSSKTATLVFNYMGFQKQEVELRGRNSLNVIMQSDNRVMEEMVVIGYGVQRKSDITGSISSISSEDIANTPVSSALQALQGRATGVNIVQNTGAPGSSTTIKVRGTGTINDSDPLYVVDGFIVDNIDYLNPNDIENVEVLKDAASSAVYGARAANGVVAITTKTGKEGKVRISYDGYVGVSNPWRTIDVLGLEDYALMRDYVTGTNNYSVDGQLYMSKDENGNYYYDESKYMLLDTVRHNGVGNWYDAISRTGVKHSHAVSVSGGSDKVQFLSSISYYNEEGIIKTSDFNRFNARLNVKTLLAKWLTLTANAVFTSERRNTVPDGTGSILKRTLMESPMALLQDNKGYWNSGHPVSRLARNHNTTSSDRLDMNISLDAKLCKLLTYSFKASYYMTPSSNDQFSPADLLNEDFIMPSTLTNVYRKQYRSDKWEMNNLLTFAWNNQHHNITVLAGQTAEGYKNTWQESTKKGTPSNDGIYHYLSSGYTGDKTYGLTSQWTAAGFIGRVNYNYGDRYLLQGNVRADGSSMFSKSNRWGVFPSVSAGWKFTGEKFMQNQNVLSLGKLRIGYGLLGNNRINALSRYTWLASGYNYSFGMGNSTVYSGITSTTLGNDAIKWEKSKSFNAAIDLGVFNNRLTVTIEHYNRLTDDILLSVPTVSSAGLDTAPMTNAGAVKNYGWEFDVKWREHRGKDWRYEIGFNMTLNKNKVTSLGTGNEPIYGSYLSEGSTVDYVTKTAVGQPIGSFFGYVTDGIFNTYEEIEQSAQYDASKNRFDQTTQPGDFRFKDLNGDGQITAEDRTYLGSPLPSLVFGIPLFIGWKNIDFHIFFQGQTGNKLYDVTGSYLYNPFNYDGYLSNVSADYWNNHWAGALVDNRNWAGINYETSNPDLRSGDANRNYRASDYFVHDGSYIRLKELTLNYSFPHSLLDKIHISNLSLSLTCYNLLTFTRYKGFDPEVGRVAGTEGNNLNMGVDHGTYPQSRTFTFGVKLGI